MIYAQPSIFLDRAAAQTPLQMGGDSDPQELLSGRQYVDWKIRSPGVYDFAVYLLDEGESVSAIAPSLPGLASHGDTEQEALQRLKEAFLALVESYAAEGQPIPWRSDADIPGEGVLRAVRLTLDA